MLDRALVVLLIAPIALSVVGTFIVNVAFSGVGMAAVPFLLTAYVLGVLIWGGLSLLLPRSLCFQIAAVVLAVSALSAITKTNTQVVLWTLGAPAAGGVAVTMPLSRSRDVA